MDKRVDYDQIAPAYNRRYTNDQGQPGIADALRRLAGEIRAARALEVGCGTGHWLARLSPGVPGLYGLDLSPGMLRQAQTRKDQAPVHLVNGRGGALPFADESFDLVYAVNAIHHFDQQRRFVAEARRLLKPGGALAVIGMDPHGRRDKWYVYEYFDGVYERDLARFPAWEAVCDWMQREGFVRIARVPVSRTRDDKMGRAVFDDPFLRKDQVSQLALLGDASYAAGLARMRAAVETAEAQGKTLMFTVDIFLEMVVGYGSV
ncbi:MAG: class I SAM-dependent methyltransferase [Anaerolineae bacterium]|nr:class I SAM-dependent methyltransferase [Anaerolineae bacterium]